MLIENTEEAKQLMTALEQCVRQEFQESPDFMVNALQDIKDVLKMDSLDGMANLAYIGLLYVVTRE